MYHMHVIDSCITIIVKNKAISAERYLERIDNDDDIRVLRTLHKERGDDDVGEIKYCKVTNEIVEFFIQEYVMFVER